MLLAPFLAQNFCGCGLVCAAFILLLHSRFDKSISDALSIRLYYDTRQITTATVFSTDQFQRYPALAACCLPIQVELASWPASLPWHPCSSRFHHRQLFPDERNRIRNHTISQKLVYTEKTLVAKSPGFGQFTCASFGADSYCVQQKKTATCDSRISQSLHCHYPTRALRSLEKDLQAVIFTKQTLRVDPGFCCQLVCEILAWQRFIPGYTATELRKQTLARARQWTTTTQK